MTTKTPEALAVLDDMAATVQLVSDQHKAWHARILAARAAFAELIDSAKQVKQAYWLARNSAADLTNYCEESASSRRCERELILAESIWSDAKFVAALAAVEVLK